MTSVCWCVFRVGRAMRNEAIPSDLYTFTGSQQGKVIITINGQPVSYITEKGYAVIKRTWKKGDVLKVDLPMDVRRVVANEKVKDDKGKVALQRGPLIYCAEWADNNGRAANIPHPCRCGFSGAVSTGAVKWGRSAAKRSAGDRY
jgi:uncharacterized protein